MKRPILEQMDARVRFDAWLKTGDDPGGGDKMGWVPQFYRDAAIWIDRGGEEVIAQRLQGTVSVRIFVDDDPETLMITPTWRAVEVKTVWVSHEQGAPPVTTSVETTTCEIRAYALKSADDWERSGGFITMAAISGAVDG